MCVPTEDSSSPSVECVLAKCEPLNLVSDEYVFQEVHLEEECCPTAEKTACLANGRRLEVSGEIKNRLMSRNLSFKS